MSGSVTASARRLALALTTLLAAASLVACNSSEDPADDSPGSATSESTADPSESSFPLTLTDASGQEITLEQPAEKVGCYWAGCDEIMAALGVRTYASPNNNENTGGSLIYPLGAPEQNPADLGGADNPESWAAAGVDLMVTRGPAIPAYDAFAPVAPLVYLYAPGLDDSGDRSGLDAYRENVLLMGQITGRDAEAEAAVARFDGFVTELAGAAPDGAADTTVAAIFQSDDGSYTMVSETSAFCAALADNDMGTCLAASARDAETGAINAEAFLALDPDWIAYLGGEDDTEFSWTERDDAVWQQLRAVQEDQVYNAVSRVFCCSLQTLGPVLQEYAFNVWGADSGVADPGNVLDYDFGDDASPLAAG